MLKIRKNIDIIISAMGNMGGSIAGSAWAVDNNGRDNDKQHSGEEDRI